MRNIVLNRAQLPQDKDREVVITCLHGQRATLAKFLPGQCGYRVTALLEGFLGDWKAAGRPIEQRCPQTERK